MYKRDAREFSNTYLKITRLPTAAVIAIFAITALMGCNRTSRNTIAISPIHASGYVPVTGPSEPTLLWKSKVLDRYDVPYLTIPVLDNNGDIYFTTIRRLYSVDKTGKIRWKFKYPGSKLSIGEKGGGRSPVMNPEGNIIMATGSGSTDMPISAYKQGRLRAFSNRGKILWTYEDLQPYAFSSTLINKEGNIYLAMTDNNESMDRGFLANFNKNGELVNDFSGKISPYTYEINDTNSGTQIFYDYGYILNKIDVNGKVSQKILPSEIILITAYGKENSLYIYMKDGRMIRLNIDDLKTVWKTDIIHDKGNTENSNLFGGKSVILINHVVACVRGIYMILENKQLVCVSNEGKVRWRTNFSIRLTELPVIDKQGSVYVTGEGRVICVGNDGKIKWNMRLTDPDNGMSAPILGPDGTLYCFADRVYAIGDAAHRWNNRPSRGLP